MKLQLKLKQNKQLVLTVGLVVLGLVIGLAGLMLAVLPQGSKAKSLDRQIADAQAKLVSLHGSGGPVIRAADLFQLARAMPDTEDMPGIVVNLADAAQRAHVVITSIQPSDSVAQADGSTAVPLKVILTGEWGGVTKFLRLLRTQVQVQKNGARLTSTGRLFVVDSVDFASNVDAKGKTTLTATLAVNAFTYGTAPPPVVTGTSTTSTTPTAPAAPGSVSATSAGSAG